MDEVGSAVAAVLAALFAGAAVAKWRTPRATERSFVALGLRAPRTLARAVPAVELATAAALVLSPRAGGWLAFALLVLFSAVLVPVVRAGRPVSCACFGGTSAAAVDAATLVRNGFLVAGALAAAAVSARQYSLGGCLAAITAVLTAAVVVALVRVRLVAGALFPSVPTP